MRNDLGAARAQRLARPIGYLFLGWSVIRIVIGNRLWNRRWSASQRRTSGLQRGVAPTHIPVAQQAFARPRTDLGLGIELDTETQRRGFVGRLVFLVKAP